MRNDVLSIVLKMLCVVLAAVCMARYCGAQTAEPVVGDDGDVVGYEPHDLSFAKRVVRAFDFEERAEGNFETMPRYWYRETGAGLPRYTEIGLDSTVRRAGRNSLRMKLNGGSAAVSLEPGVVGVVPEGRYVVTVSVRTEGAVASRVVLEGWYVDARGERIEASRRSSAAITSEGVWRVVELRMPDAPGDAGWMVLRVGLMQPERLGGGDADPNALHRVDLDSVAWVDDVEVAQVPRISLKTAEATNVFVLPDEVEYEVSVHDLTGQNLEAWLRTYDQAGRLVDEHRRGLEIGRPGTWRWRPRLPGVGWYWTELAVMTRDGSKVAGREWCSTVVMEEVGIDERVDQDRFMVLAEDGALGGRDEVAEMMGKMGRHGILFDVWDEASSSVYVRETLIDRLIDEGRRVGLSVGEVPSGLARVVDVDEEDVLGLFGRAAADWAPHLEPIFARYGAEVRDWVIGWGGGGWDGRSAVLHDAADRFLGRFVVGRRVFVPMGVHEPMDSSMVGGSGTAGVGRAVWVRVPTSVRASDIGKYLGEMGALGLVAAEFETLDPAMYSRADRATDLALRLLESWELGVGTMAVRHPWVEHERTAGHLQPDAMLPVWTTVTRQLAGRRSVGRFEPGPGITAMMLRGNRGDGMVVWRSGPEGDGVMAFDEADGVSVTDVWGVRRAVSGGVLDVGDSPLFVEGMDLRLMRFRAGFRVEPGLLRSVYAGHDAEVTLTNPWSTTINGRLRVTGPERWEIKPVISLFTIAPGESIRLPVTMSFPINEVAGAKRLTARVELDADRRYEIDVWAPMEVGLDDLEMDTKLEIRGDDAVVTLRVTSHGGGERSYYGFVLAPGMPRQQRIISTLGPGQSVVKTFVIVGGGEVLSGQVIRAGVRQIDGPEILNHMLDVP